MTAGAWMADGGFVAVSEFVRQRAVLVADPYDPDAAGVPSWDAPDEVTVWGYLASISSTEGADPVRRQVLAAKQLVLDDPGADVERGDRIRQGARVWVVVGFPVVDMNPFTGWRPTRVVNLEEVQG